MGMKILITGIAGTGKSTLIEMLNQKGVIATDLHDVEGLFFWQDKKTKEKIEYLPLKSKERFESVERICDIAKLKNILTQHLDVVMAGTTSGDEQLEFLSLFDKIILLQSEPSTLIHRMTTRINKSGFGKTKAEQDDNLEWQKEYDSALLSYGAIPFSTEGEVDFVAGNLIQLINIINNN